MCCSGPDRRQPHWAWTGDQHCCAIGRVLRFATCCPSLFERAASEPHSQLVLGLTPPQERKSWLGAQAELLMLSFGLVSTVLQSPILASGGRVDQKNYAVAAVQRAAGAARSVSLPQLLGPVAAAAVADAAFELAGAAAVECEMELVAETVFGRSHAVGCAGAAHGFGVVAKVWVGLLSADWGLKWQGPTPKQSRTLKRYLVLG